MPDSGTRFTLSRAVVTAVADAKDVAATDLDPPLATVVDPDALDTLFASGTTGKVRFQYSGYEVTVSSEERVELERVSVPPADD